MGNHLSSDADGGEEVGQEEEEEGTRKGGEGGGVKDDHNSNGRMKKKTVPTAPISHLLAIKEDTSALKLADKGRALFQAFNQVQEKHAEAYAQHVQGTTRKYAAVNGSNSSIHNPQQEKIYETTVEFISSVLETSSPRLFKEYEVLEPIACGTSALVCKMRSTQTGKLVAGKFGRLGSGIQARGRRLQQFRLETKYQKICACDQVVKLLDYEELKDYVVIIMEYLPTTLLRQTIISNRVHKHPELQAAIHTRSIAQALAVCHSQGIVHLDVKLDNILCTHDGQAKLCDFGLADIAPARRSEATPLFCPPEVLTTQICSTKADMWSLGVVLYILLCGFPPFQPDETHTLEEQIVNARYMFRRGLFAGVSGLARDLVSRLLVLDPEIRYSAKQVLEHPWILASIQGERAFHNISLMDSSSPNESLIRARVMRDKEQKVTSLTKSNSIEENLDHVADALDNLAQGQELKKRVRKVQMMLRFIRSYQKSHRPPLSTEEAAGSSSSSVISTPTISRSATPISIIDESHRLNLNKIGEIGVVQSSGNVDRQVLEEWPRYCLDSTSLKAPPIWLPNSEATCCRCCGADFGLIFNRRHHCRSCGQIVCDSCSTSRRIVKRVDPVHPVRVCDQCRASNMIAYRLGSTLHEQQQQQQQSQGGLHVVPNIKTSL